MGVLNDNHPSRVTVTLCAWCLIINAPMDMDTSLWERKIPRHASDTEHDDAMQWLYPSKASVTIRSTAPPQCDHLKLAVNEKHVAS